MDWSVNGKSKAWGETFNRELENFKEQLRELDDRIDADEKPERGNSTHQEVLQAFEESQRSCREYELEYGDDIDHIREVQSHFRSEISTWFCKSWIAQRAHSKPSGFAGDFEMLRKLYDEATPARGLGGYVDLCILE